MDEINIEKIMEEIRREIREKGYQDNLLSFDEMEDGEQIDQQYSEAVYRTLLHEMNEKSNILWYRNLEGGTVSRLLKKVIRKLTSFLGVPVVVDQSSFNAEVAHEFAQLLGYVCEQKDELNLCRQRIAQLEETVEELRKNKSIMADDEKRLELL